MVELKSSSLKTILAFTLYTKMDSKWIKDQRAITIKLWEENIEKKNFHAGFYGYDPKSTDIIRER